MVASTPNSSLPYPEPADLPQVNVHLQNLATSVDTISIPRFTNSGARASAIPSPSNGQAGYLQSTEQLGIFKSGYTSFMDVSRPNLIRMKTADENVNASTVFQDDDHINGMVLKASTWYLVRGLFFFTSPSAANAKFILVWTGSSPSASDSFWCIKNQRQTAGATEQRSAVITAQIAPATDNGGYVIGGTIEGIVLTSSPAPTVKMQFAQNTASGTMTVFRGSYLEFIEAS